MTPVLEAVYADGWDDAVVNPMTPDEASGRDAAGLPYAVLLLAAGRLHTRLHLSWRDRYCQLTTFDAFGRTVIMLDLRRGDDGDLFLFEKRTWNAPDDVSQHEFVNVAARHLTRYLPNGRRLDIDEPRGDRGGSSHTQSFDTPPRLTPPTFGRWAPSSKPAADIKRPDERCASRCTPQAPSTFHPAG